MDYFSGQDSDSSPSTKPKIFKQRKTNLPSSKKYKPPEDKGGGLIILNTDEYLRSCHAHLSSVRTNEDGSESPYYRRVEADILDEAKTEILSVLKDGKDKGIISDVEFQVMDPTDKGQACFYETFKVHKSHEPGRAPPERPIISGSGSFTKNLSAYVQHHIKDLSNKHPSYLKKRDLNKACGAHFSSRGHSVHDMKVSILEKVHSDDELLREERESMFIRDFNCKYKGINRQT